MLVAERIPLDLVRHQLSFDGFIQSFELERIEVGYADLTDQSFLLQVKERPPCLPRIDQRIFSVDQVQIDTVSLQSLKAFFTGLYDTVVGRIVIAKRLPVDHLAGYTGLCDQFDPPPDRRVLRKCFSHQSLAVSSAIDFGCVKCCNTSVDAAVHK